MHVSRRPSQRQAIMTRHIRNRPPNNNSRSQASGSDDSRFWCMRAGRALGLRHLPGTGQAVDPTEFRWVDENHSIDKSEDKERVKLLVL
jgi:hypothetical protein